MPQKSWQKKVAEKDYNAYLKRVSTIKSVVALDRSEPKKFSKSMRKENERRRQYAEIDRENRLLLERLAKIMQQKTIDNENDALKYKKSLSQTTRRQELERITDENQRLLRRIQEAEPCYNHLKWEEAAQTREVYLRNMTEFPDTFEENRRKLMASLAKDTTGRNSADSLEAGAGEDRALKRHGLLRPLSSEG